MDERKRAFCWSYGIFGLSGNEKQLAMTWFYIPIFPQWLKLKADLHFT